MAQRILALEMAGDQVRAAVAERTWDTFKLLGTFEAERNSGEPDMSGAISRVVAEAGHPDIVISALPGELVANRVLSLPFKEDRKLRQVVPFALEEHLPFPVDDAVATFTRIGQDSEGTIVLAAVVRKEDLRAHLELVGKAGLDPKRVTLAPLALACLLVRARAESERNGHGTARLVIDIDRNRTSLVLLDPSGAPRAMRTVVAGLEANGHASLPPRVMLAIVSAARQTLLAHGSDLEPPELLIAGPAAAMPEVRAEIVQGLASAVRKAGDPGYSAPLEELQPDSAPFAACVAMLFGESPVEPLELLNFRQGDFAFQGRTGDIAPLYTSGILAAAIAFMVVLNLVLGIAISLHRVSVMNSQIEAIAGLVLGPRRAADAQGALRAGIADMEKQLTLMGGSVARGSALDAVQAISKAIPQRLAVEFSDLQIDRSGLKLSGTADSFGIIDNVKRSLTQGGFFGEIEVNDAKAGATGGKVEFTLSAAPSDNPAPGME